MIETVMAHVAAKAFVTKCTRNIESPPLEDQKIGSASYQLLRDKGELGLTGKRAAPRPEERRVSRSHLSSHANVILAIGFQRCRAEERQPLDRRYQFLYVV